MTFFDLATRSAKENRAQAPARINKLVTPQINRLVRTIGLLSVKDRVLLSASVQYFVCVLNKASPKGSASC